MLSDIKKSPSVLAQHPFFLPAMVELAVATGASLALWKNPDNQEINLLVDFAKRPVREAPSLEKKGFLVAPFVNGGTAWRLQPDVFWKSNAGLKRASFPDEILEKLEQKLAEKKKSRIQDFLRQKKEDALSHEQETHYTELVRKSVEAIKEGSFRKVVPSRRAFLPVQVAQNLPEHFFTLTQKYPSAFVSLVHSPAFGTWLTATPELLVSQNAAGIFKTVALAGTQPFQESVKAARWGQKEIEEQAFVARYIINAFKKLRLREFEEEGPKTVRAGKLVHLQTRFKVDTKITERPKLIEEMLQLLHPTSAVCGMPLAPAQAFLARHEGYERELYSGYLGPWQLEDESRLFVNLRCAQVMQNGAWLYAGAGVTEDSDPQKEWTETALKMRTMGKVLQEV